MRFAWLALSIALAGASVAQAVPTTPIPTALIPAPTRPPPSNPTPPAPPVLNVAPVFPRYYPRPAADQGLEGEAIINCRRTPQLAFAGCRLISETPAGQGFGPATLAMAADAPPNPKLDVTDPAQLAPRDYVVDFRLRPARTSPDLSRMAHVNVPPKILTGPTHADFDAAWPAAQRAAHPDGFASMSCHVTVEGRLARCVVLEEHPLHEGFADAALALADHFTLSPWRVDGEALEHPDMRVPIAFDAPQSGPEVRKANAELQTAESLIAAWYPAGAKAKGLEGEATISCRRMPHGAPAGCFVVSQSPPGAGFGDAALVIAARAKDDPSVDVPAPYVQAYHPITFSFRLKPTLSIEPNLLLPYAVQPSEWFGPPDAGDDLSHYYPHRAQRLGIPGRAVLDCRAFADGHLDDCAVASESPPDQGFGHAAVLMARKFKVKPGPGGRLVIPIDFALPTKTPPPPPVLAPTRP
jgi:TonB family protein